RLHSVIVPGWRHAGSPRSSRCDRGGRALALGLFALLALACQRGRNPPDPAPVPAARTISAPEVSKRATPPDPGSGAAGSTAVPGPAEALTGDGLYLSTNKYEEQVVQRVALPTGQAFLISRGPESWLTSEGE